MERSRGRFVALDNGAFIALDRQFRLELERLSRFGDGLKIPAAAGVGSRDLLDAAQSVKADQRWKAFVHRLDEAERAEPKLPAGFLAELRDCQRDGFVWMSRLAGWGAGALLADDVGLGKTVQAIAVMVAKAARPDPGRRANLRTRQLDRRDRALRAALARNSSRGKRGSRGGDRRARRRRCADRVLRTAGARAGEARRRRLGDGGARRGAVQP